MVPWATEEAWRHEPWRPIIAERAAQAVAALARVPGVLGLILAGSVGRGEAWPLSDVDIIPVYEDGRVAEAASAVEATRLDLLEWWTDEGYCASLDVGRLAFARAEVAQALRTPPRGAAALLGDARWFHSLDKAYRGRAPFDPEGLAAALAAWLTAARFAPEVVRGRLGTHWGHALTRHEQATTALRAGHTLAAAVALREGLHVLTRYLMETWGGRDNSFARFGTRFERTAAVRGAGALAAESMALYGLTPDEVGRRPALAPHGLRYRHRLSLAARHLVGEAVTAEQDARDVLLVFSTMKLRRGRPPFDRWVGLETDRAILADHLDRYRQLLARARAAEHNPASPSEAGRA